MVQRSQILEDLSLIRVPLAVVIASVTPAAVITIYTLFSRMPFDGAIFLILFGTPVAFLHAILLGLPAYLLTQKLNIAKWWAGLVGGFLIGAGPWTILAWIGYGSLTMAYQHGDLKLSPIIGVIGMVSGFTAWLTWHLLRPRMPAARPVL